jgi:hypothetical protein
MDTQPGCQILVTDLRLPTCEGSEPAHTKTNCRRLIILLWLIKFLLQKKLESKIYVAQKVLRAVSIQITVFCVLTLCDIITLEKNLLSTIMVK